MRKTWAAIALPALVAAFAFPAASPSDAVDQFQWNGPHPAVALATDFFVLDDGRAAVLTGSKHE